MLNLASMIPGGFVEVRDFSRYPAVILGCFNLFLTVLGLGSLVLAYFVYATETGYTLTAVVGVGYCAVYLADLYRIFPISPVPMSTLLNRLEWLGTLLGIALVVVGIWARLRHDATSDAAQSFSISTPILLILLFFGLIILAFATRAAMKKTADPS
ncbi:hypothetical protein ACLPHM_01390 [Paenalcaligenes sp. Me131]|uniref:hypothetical protein n=1 Tax=Paenalcaligenes sp. Me131 TaxID=3392636 RepID=UPI003D2C1821